MIRTNKILKASKKLSFAKRTKILIDEFKGRGGSVRYEKSKDEDRPNTILFYYADECIFGFNYESVNNELRVNIILHLISILRIMDLVKVENDRK